MQSISNKIISLLLLLIYVSPNTINAKTIKTEIDEDAKNAIKIFEESFSETGINGVILETIPDCYSKINSRSSHRAVRVCGMIDLWAINVEATFSKLFKKEPNSYLVLEKFVKRLEEAISKIDENELKYLGENWLDRLISNQN